MSHYDVFRAILTMSITGSVIALILYALKPLVRNRLPKAAQYYLWIVVLVALLVPISRFVVLPTTLSGVPTIHSTVEWYVVSTDDLFNRIEPYEVIDENGYIGILEEKQAEVDELIPEPWVPGLIDFIMFICLFGSIIYLGITLTLYATFKCKIKAKNLPVTRDEKALLFELCSGKQTPLLYRNSLAATPMLIGVFEPMIVLPDQEYSTTQLRAILLHELTHLRRKDVLVKWFSTFAVCLHWFNPTAHLVRREIDSTSELACDEAVIKNMNNDSKQSYGDTLIAMAADHKTPKMIVSTTMCEEKKTLKTRLGAIMKHKRFSSWTIAVSCVLVAVVLCGTVVMGASAQSETAAEFFIHQYRNEAAVFRPVSILAERTLEDETILLFYLNAKGNLGCAVVQKGMLGYKLVGTSSELAIEGKSPAQVMCSSLHTGKWLALGFLRDDAIESAAFYEQEITIVEADNLRLCYATGDGYIPDDHSFMFFDSSGNVVWDMMASSFSKAMTVYIWREQDSIKYALFDSAKVGRTEEDIKNSELIFSAVSELNAAFSDYAIEGMHLYIQYDMTEFTKEEMDAISDQFKVPVGNYSTSTGAIRVQ